VCDVELPATPRRIHALIAGVEAGPPTDLATSAPQTARESAR
jgi:hypothetical protein